ncbi:hypothetical protein [Hyphomicrobium sp.]|uniref:hypothetical protein n=1 Tax=Hyphomicrobium sp. TaxID=82 RepID=UPI002C3ED7DE|nr:hypothetical protein [Hyphomicrobium sp.]HVZ05886.1 hypothetical protein [Hyphomicrobium sp.]
MSLRPPLPLLLALLGAALFVMFIAASTSRKAEAAVAAALFAILLISSAIRTNSPFWQRNAINTGVTPRDALWQTTRLIMLAYLWCALAFYAVYLGTTLHWQHGWEYGSAILLIAIGHAIYLRRLADPNDAVSTPSAIERAVRLSSYQAIAIAVGLIWLIQSGKLSSLKGDWAANQLFLAGGFAVMCLSVIIIKTNAALSERPAR